jgi:hypothetical protein
MTHLKLLAIVFLLLAAIEFHQLLAAMLHSIVLNQRTIEEIADSITRLVFASR